ncbi:uncharacterized protein ALTATR162_LOCUS4304 [Alternaria atra]|uniref:Peptidase C15, pyroglutamyl peptidase I-like protein n=1 Tax=Alternaria atra TaxID=119953 RepID=A0A8J2I1E6_9PLEO|nr:uncharacterized protein ALTATR162_LOCUS4304 [Alternaria atra]CAG5156507.1 unnamed protein product [Alternaria atra]
MSTSVKVLVTGFGPFLDITKNPSWEIARHLPSSIAVPDGGIVNIMVPAEPIPAAYHKILTQVPALIQEHAPDLIVHMGLDVDSGPGVFKIERSALRDGYHDIPDVERRVFMRTENKKIFAKSSPSLATTLDIDRAAEVWREACSSLSLPNASAAPGGVKAKGKGKSRQPIEVTLSDDVGSYVCGFNYYISLLEMQKHTTKREVVFFHVPKLETEEEIQTGVKVAEGLIRALVVVGKQ